MGARVDENQGAASGFRIRRGLCVSIRRLFLRRVRRRGAGVRVDVNGARDVFLGLIIVILGCQLAKCPTAKSRPRLFRPTVQWEMATSLIARKDRGSARVDDERKRS